MNQVVKKRLISMVLKRRVGLALFAICAPMFSFAVIPVIDVKSLISMGKSIAQMKKQYALLQRSYKNSQLQLDQAKRLKDDVEGHYGMGGLLNGLDSVNKQQWSPNNWQDALKGLAGGNPQRYKQLLSAYKKAHPSMSEQEFAKHTSKSQAKVFHQDVMVNQAATVNATYAFNNINDHIKRVHALSMQIDKANNTKAAMDLNSRLITELAYIQIQELKMQSLLNQQIAQANADVIAGKIAKAKFNVLKKP